MNYLLRLTINILFIVGTVLGIIDAGTLDYYLEVYGNSGPDYIIWMGLVAIVLMLPKMFIVIKENVGE